MVGDGQVSSLTPDSQRSRATSDGISERSHRSSVVAQGARDSNKVSASGVVAKNLVWGLADGS